MKEIILSQEKVALVDDCDFGFLNCFKWYAKKSNASWYVVRMKSVNKHSSRGCHKNAKVKTKREVIRMHNFIMQPTENEVVHHKDGDGLNNQRYNLECISPLENGERARDKRKEKSVDDIPF